MNNLIKAPPPEAPVAPAMPTFEQELTKLLNKHSQETQSQTPDYILAKYLVGCLRSFEEAHSAKKEWFAGMDDTFSAATTSFKFGPIQ